MSTKPDSAKLDGKMYQQNEEFVFVLRTLSLNFVLDSGERGSFRVFSRKWERQCGKDNVGKTKWADRCRSQGTRRRPLRRVSQKPLGHAVGEFVRAFQPE